MTDSRVRASLIAPDDKGGVGSGDTRGGGSSPAVAGVASEESTAGSPAGDDAEKPGPPPLPHQNRARSTTPTTPIATSGRS